MISKPVAALAVSIFALLPAGADVKNANAAPFAGDWMIAFPEGEGVIVNVPIVTCDQPAMIEQVGDTSIHVVTPGGDMGVWEVKSFGGKNPWWQENSESLLADWIGEDAFLLAGRDATGIKADWANAKQWTRCKAK